MSSSRPASPGDGTPEDVVAARAGDLDARERLVVQHLPDVHRVCYWMLNDPDAAADAAQDTVLLALESLSLYTGDGDFGAWLRSIAMNRCRRLRERASRFRHTEVPDDLLSPRRGPDDRAIISLAAAVVRTTLDGLPHDQHIAFVLREVEGLSYSDIASACDTTPDAIRLRLHRARLAVLKELSSWT